MCFWWLNQELEVLYVILCRAEADNEFMKILMKSKNLHILHILMKIICMVLLWVKTYKEMDLGNKNHDECGDYGYFLKIDLKHLK